MLALSVILSARMFYILFYNLRFYLEKPLEMLVMNNFNVFAIEEPFCHRQRLPRGWFDNVQFEEVAFHDITDIKKKRFLEQCL